MDMQDLLARQKAAHLRDGAPTERQKEAVAQDIPPSPSGPYRARKLKFSGTRFSFRRCRSIRTLWL